MKKNRITIIILIILSVLAAYILMNKKKSTIDEEIKDFAVEDTSTIDKIFIAEKSGETALLERKRKGYWTINGKYPASMESVNLLLYTFKRIEVKYPAGENAKLTIIRSIATQGKKIEVYQNGKRTKIWYMGAVTPDQTGTFMALADPETDEKYEQPFINWIPGFEGFLNTRFFTNEADWRDKKIISALPTEIENIRMNYTGLPDSSFQITVKGVNSFEVRNSSGIKIEPINDIAVKQYLAYFVNLGANGFLTEKSKQTIDSLRRTPPFANLILTLKSGKKDIYKFYHKSLEKLPEDFSQQKFTYDPDNVYLSFNSDQDMAMVQYFVFGKVFQTSAYFRPQTVKK